MADYLEDIVQNIYTKCDLTDFNLLIHATDDLTKKANKLGRAFSRALTGDQQVALAKSNEIISHNVARQKEATVALAEHNKEISWNKVLLAEQNRLKAENNNATKIATQDRDRQISQDRLQNQLSKERTAQIKKETDAMRRQSNIMRSLGRLFVTYFGISTIRGIIKTGSRLQLVQKSIEGLTKSTQDWEFLNQQAYKFGLSLNTVASGYKNFYSSASMAGFGKGQIQSMFGDILLGARSIGASDQQIGGALLALEQMMSKGRVSMEELRRQLGNALPGAFEIGAKAMGVTTAKFNEMVEAGISANEFVPKFIKTFKEQYQNGWKDVEQTASVALGRLGYAWEKFTIDFLHGESGKNFAKAINSLADLFVSPEFQQFVSGLGTLFGWLSKIVELVTPFIKWVIRNLPIILALLGGAGLYKLIKMLGFTQAELNSQMKWGVFWAKLFGKESVKSFLLASRGAIKMGLAFMRALLPILVIQDVLLFIIGLLTGSKINTVTGSLVDITGEIAEQIRAFFNIRKPSHNTNDQIIYDIANNDPEYNRAKRIKDPLKRQEAMNKRIGEIARGVRGENGITGPAAPISGTFEPYTPPDIIPSGLPISGAAPIGGMLNKEQEVTTSVNIGDINVYSNASNPQQVAQEVQEQLIALFMGQGLITDVEGYA